MSKSLVLLSGGLDSAVTAYIANKECDGLYALTFRYGQAHSREVDCALQLGFSLGVERQKILELPLNKIGGSSLFDKDKVPTEETGGIPVTWVPQRNSIFLAIAFAWAEVIGADRIYIGVNAIDYSGYPDCRPEFILSMGDSLNLASKKYVETGERVWVQTPILKMSKAEIIRKGIELGAPFEYTWSCYKGGELACGKCDSCRLRLKGFEEAGLKDPIRYEGEK